MTFLALENEFGGGANLGIGLSSGSSQGAIDVDFYAYREGILVPELTDIMEEINGDYNADGIVDVGDLNLVLFNWDASTVPPERVNQIPAGNVSVDQLNAVLFNWNAMAPAVATVPEPTSTGLLVVSIGWLAICGRRRQH